MTKECYYATAEIEAFMNRPESFPLFATEARDHIRKVHALFAPSNRYDPKTFDHLKELNTRELFTWKFIREHKDHPLSAELRVVIK